MTATATADAAGAATATLRPRGGRLSEVKQVSVELLAAGGGASTAVAPTCVLRWNGFLVAPAIAFGDAIGGDPPIEVGPADLLTVEVTGATAGDQLRALGLYDWKRE
jgi:hypothetical protein